MLPEALLARAIFAMAGAMGVYGLRWGASLDAQNALQHAFKLTNRVLDGPHGNLFMVDGHPCNQTRKNQVNQMYPLTADPPEDQVKRMKANLEALKIVHDVFETVGLPLILSDGSALGFYRSCGAIPGDPDVDVMLPISWVQEEGVVEKLKLAFAAKGGSFRLSLCPKGVSHTGCEARVIGWGTYADIFFLEEEPCTSPPCTFATTIWPGGSVKETGYARCPFTTNFESLTFLNRTMWTPSVEYLEQRYGPDFMHPKREGGNWPVYGNCNFKDLKQPEPALLVHGGNTARAVLDLEKKTISENL